MGPIDAAQRGQFRDAPRGRHPGGLITPNPVRRTHVEACSLSPYVALQHRTCLPRFSSSAKSRKTCCARQPQDLGVLRRYTACPKISHLRRLPTRVPRLITAHLRHTHSQSGAFRAHGNAVHIMPSREATGSEQVTCGRCRAGYDRHPRHVVIGIAIRPISSQSLESHVHVRKVP